MFSSLHLISCSFVFFFTETATTEIYTLSLHYALPILRLYSPTKLGYKLTKYLVSMTFMDTRYFVSLRSEEHTSELQSRGHLVCRLLLEKKKPHPQTSSYRPSC